MNVFRNKRGERVGRACARGCVSASWLAALGAASIFLLAANSAGAADDRFDRTKFDGLGGFQPVTNDAYRKECGGCHFAYLPGLLPARSWDRMLDNVANHFGENLGLSADLSRSLREYLTLNAADRVPEKGPAVLLERLDPDRTPARVTQVPLIARRHLVVRDVLRTNTHASVQVRGLTNCDTCHEKAAQGSFALEHTVIPGVTKVVRPGGQF